ncbi:ribonuclease H-like domain-containing protein [Tanacetum coccineum]
MVMIITSLHAEFSMTDLGSLNYFLGISVTRNASGMFLSQQKYATEVLDRAGMLNCKPCRTPVDTDSKLSADGAPISDSTLYRSLAGALQYLTFTRPDISYAVQQIQQQKKIMRKKGVKGPALYHLKLCFKEYHFGGVVDWCLPDANETELCNVWPSRRRFHIQDSLGTAKGGCLENWYLRAQIEYRIKFGTTIVTE